MFALLLTATTAHAWWPAGQGTIDVWYDGLSPDEEAIFDEAIDAWNAGPHDILLATVSEEPANVQISWGHPDEELIIGTITDGETGELMSLDIVLDGDLDLDASDTFTDYAVYNGSALSFRAYATHVLARALDIPLPDAAGGPNLRGNDWDECSALENTTAHPELGGVLVDALMDHHGAKSTPVTDVGFLHFRQASWSSGGGSAHEFSRVRAYVSNVFRDLTSTTGVYDVPVAKVPAGHRVYAEFMLDNQGTDCESVDYDLYLSDNVNLTSLDTFLRSGGGINKCPGPAMVSNYWFDVPTTAVGVKYIGIVVDVPGDQNPDNDEAWLPIEVVANGHADLCSYGVPCKRGYGDCDSNAECASGTTCRWDVGANYGFSSTTDVCE